MSVKVRISNVLAWIAATAGLSAFLSVSVVAFAAYEEWVKKEPIDFIDVLFWGDCADYQAPHPEYGYVCDEKQSGVAIVEIAGEILKVNTPEDAQVEELKRFVIVEVMAGNVKKFEDGKIPGYQPKKLGDETFMIAAATSMLTLPVWFVISIIHYIWVGSFRFLPWKKLSA